MKDIEREWREVARLIAAEKEAALAELRCRPLAPPQPEAAPAARRLRLELLPVAASLLLAAGLAALWLLRGSWQGASLAPAGSQIMADSLLYAAAGRAEAPAAAAAPEAASSYFTALAGSALRTQPGGRAAASPEALAPPAVERGDPDQVRRALGRALRMNAFERALSQIQQFHAQEA
jgi:hypothetical protein